MQNSHGTLEYARPHDGHLVLRGWMIDALGPFDRIAVHAGGVEIGDAMPIDRPDLAAALGHVPNCENAGFHVTAPLDQLDGDGHMSLVLMGMRDGEACAEMRVGWMLASIVVPVPPAHLSMRVAHTDLDYLYRAGGGKSAFDFFRAAKRHGAGQAKRVLEWGCGPGRVTAHMRHLFPDADLHGTDLDHEALRWAGIQFPSISFTKGNAAPPLPFADGSFDLILGGSVFSHLTRDLQQAWLPELRRLLSPGGVALVSTLGLFAASMSPTGAGIREQLLASGFDDSILDPALDGIAPEGYYRATWQTIEWTRSEWSQCMTVLEVEEAGFENYQDLWALTR